jgi:4-hydroxybenzoate polyprenyltransferase
LKKTAEKFLAVLDLIRWTKQYGTLLLVAPALWSLMIATQGTPPLGLVIIFFLGAFLMRSAGCAINDIIDQRFDVQVQRTKGRPLPSGRLNIPLALAVFAGFSLFAFSLIWWLNPLTRLLSVVAILLAVLYPFTKRFFHFPQMFMGAAFGWGAVMAWTAVRNTIEFPVILIFLATSCWAAAYDTIYAMMDMDEDREIGVKSSALLFGKNTWLAVGILFALSLIFLSLLGFISDLGPVYGFTIFTITICFFYQVLLLRHGQDRHRLFLLFKSHVGIGLLLLIGIFLGYQFP